MSLMRILKKIIIGLLIFLVVHIVIFYRAAAGEAVHHEKDVRGAAPKASIEKISINPYAISVTIKGFSLEDPGKPKPFVAFDELYVNADLMSSFSAAL